MKDEKDELLGQEEEEEKEEKNGEEEDEYNEDIKKEETEFNDLIKNEKYFEIKKLLRESKTPKKIWKYKSSNDDSTILHLSIIQNNTKIIKEILKYCKKYLSKNKFINFINKKNNKGIAPIHYASFKGNVEIVHNLIKDGADLNSITDKSLNVIHFACQGKKVNILLYFDIYHKNKIDFNSKDKKNSTPLHWSCFSSSYECAEFLLNKGVKMNTKDNDGNTPLHLSIIKDAIKILRLLLQKGAKTEIKNNKEETPMQLAANRKKREIYEMFKNNNKCEISNFKAPVKKIDKSKKFIFIAIFYKIFSHYILFSNIFPYLFNNNCYEYINFISFILYFIINMIIPFLYFYLVCSNPGYVKSNAKVKDFKNLLFDQKEEFDNFCFKCSIFKSETRKHCIICDKCCEEFDHHCFWLDKCVGKNNYISFIFLLYLSTIDFIIIIIISIYTLFNIFYFEQKDNCNNNINEYIESLYKFIKDNLSLIEIKYDFIPENKILENLHIIFFLAIDILVLIPLIYLLILHTKNCKNKNKSKMNLSGSFLPENQSIQRNNNVFKNINKENIELVNELLKKNNFQFHINQRSSQSLDGKTFSHNKFNFRNMVTEKTFYRNNNFTNTERYSENGIVKTINKTKSENINTRKLSKESFKSDIMKRIGKKKVKYKIIGRLITEPNLKSPKKT